MIDNSGPVLLQGPGGQDFISVNTDGEATVAYPSGGYEFCFLQAVPTEGTIATRVLTLQESMDGENWVNTSVTIAAAGYVGSAIWTIRTPYLRVAVTTKEGSASLSRVYAYFWNSNISRGF